MQFAPLTQPASAADLPGGSLKDTPYVVVPSWQGLYFGGHAGGVWGNTNVHDHFDYVGDPEFNGNLGSTGFIGGAQAGYNIQRGHFVFGPEADIGYLGISASKSKNNTPGSCTAYYSKGPGTYDPKTGLYSQDYSGHLCEVDAKYSTSSSLYGDLTGRLGYATGQTLFYAKGGAALLNAELKSAYKGGNAGAEQWHTFNFSNSDTLVGWTLGGGAEYALSPSWSLKAEYQHFDFGKASHSYKDCHGIPGTYSDPTYGVCPPANSTGSNHYTSTINGKTDVSITADAVKLGINYHLGNDAGMK